MAHESSGHRSEGLTRRLFVKGAAMTMLSGAAAAFAQEQDAQTEDQTLAPKSLEEAEDATLPASAREATMSATPDAPVEEEDTSNDPYAKETGAGDNFLYKYSDLTESIMWLPDASFMLPLGCNVFADCDSRAAVLQSNEGGNPFTVVGCLDYASNTYSVVMRSPLSGRGYSASEVHITDRLIAWVEMNDATSDWVLYAGPFDGGEITSTAQATQLAQGDKDWLPPQVAVAGAIVIWQLMPDPNGPYVRDYSHAYKWVLGNAQPTELWESPGRFACPPNINEGTLTIAPRLVSKSGVYYGITAVDMSSGSAIDQLALPVNVRPLRATRIGNRFVFSIEANYGYGGLLGKMGYYFGREGGPFDYVAREPSAQVNYVNGYYIVRSQLSYFVVDPVMRTFSRIGAATDCVDYGDYPATEGTRERFVTYTNIKDTSTGIPSYCLVRVFSLAESVPTEAYLEAQAAQEAEAAQAAQEEEDDDPWISYEELEAWQQQQAEEDPWISYEELEAWQQQQQQQAEEDPWISYEELEAWQQQQQQ